MIEENQNVERVVALLDPMRTDRKLEVVPGATTEVIVLERDCNIRNCVQFYAHPKVLISF